MIEGYPFPEIYLTGCDVDLDSGEGNQILIAVSRESQRSCTRYSLLDIEVNNACLPGRTSDTA